MLGAILKARDCSFQKGMAFCHSIYVKKVMKLLVFILEQPSYCYFPIWNPGTGADLNVWIPNPCCLSYL